MPTYLYYCNNCGNQEILQSINDETLTQCPLCNTLDFRKTFSKVGLIFKGKGFYTTDSKNK